MISEIGSEMLGGFHVALHAFPERFWKQWSPGPQVGQRAQVRGRKGVGGTKINQNLLSLLLLMYNISQAGFTALKNKHLAFPWLLDSKLAGICMKSRQKSWNSVQTIPLFSTQENSTPKIARLDFDFLIDIQSLRTRFNPLFFMLHQSKLQTYLFLIKLYCQIQTIF